MTKYKVLYRREVEMTMIVNADSEEEALEKYEEYDFLEDYETQGLREELIDIIKVDEIQ